jgi:dihydropteroate synthase
MKEVAELTCADKTLTFNTPKIMGILNLTPDSFADGGRYNNKDLSLKRVEQMIDEGADIIDIGAESSRPYAQRVSTQAEIDRLLEVFTAVRDRFDVVLSVDTYKPSVMSEVIKVGAHLINDIYALQVEGSLDVIAKSQVAVCLMHMQGTPDTMQDNPSYDNVVPDVVTFLEDRVNACLSAGISRNRIIIDPGFGFGKTTKHNMTMLRNLRLFQRLGLPILAGLSRKASIGEILAVPVEDRLFGSLSAHVIAAIQGAAVIRTHDVKPTAQALKIAQAVMEQEAVEWQ